MTQGGDEPLVNDGSDRVFPDPHFRLGATQSAPERCARPRPSEVSVPFLLVPGRVLSDNAEVWLAAIDTDVPPVGLVLTVGDRNWDVGSWDRWASTEGRHRLDYQRVFLDELEPGRGYPLRLSRNGRTEATATVRTLPITLPTGEEKPFVALVGSCFFPPSDRSGAVGSTVFRLPAGADIDIKFLCGDQVYLDAPWSYFLTRTHTRAEMESRFFVTYVRTWTQSGSGLGFQELLRSGANYFTSDDHDYWNNAPNFAVYVRDTWGAPGRESWWETASDLYAVFQRPATVSQFRIGTLAFFVADTRSHRQPTRTRFMTTEDMDSVARWVQELDGPGVLVLGQTLFAERAGWWGLAGHIGDWGLPDFDQYADLVRALFASRHSIVVVTGDVHYGRIASCQLPSGVELIEVISSPMSLVDPLARGKPKPAATRFPASAVHGVRAAATETVPFEPFRGADNHFLTLEFSQYGRRVRMAAKVWPIASGGAGGSPRLADVRYLQ